MRERGGQEICECSRLTVNDWNRLSGVKEAFHLGAQGSVSLSDTSSKLLKMTEDVQQGAEGFAKFCPIVADGYDASIRCVSSMLSGALYRYVTIPTTTDDRGHAVVLDGGSSNVNIDGRRVLTGAHRCTCISPRRQRRRIDLIAGRQQDSEGRASGVIPTLSVLRDPQESCAMLPTQATRH